MAQLVMNLLSMQDTWVRSLGWKDPLEKEKVPTPVFWPGEFHMDSIVHVVATRWSYFTGQSCRQEKDAQRIPQIWNPSSTSVLLQKEMATHSSILAWKIPRTEEPWQVIIHGVAKSRTQLSK